MSSILFLVILAYHRVCTEENLFIARELLEYVIVDFVDICIPGREDASM
jgi:hypothetical protein